MNEALRTTLYPFGFIASLLFGIRFFFQWWDSERRGKSHVDRKFWLLSLWGNGALILHAFIQIQYPIFILQSCNLLISWRNLDLSRSNKAPTSFKTVALLLGFLILGGTALFAWSAQLAGLAGTWLEVPHPPWQSQLYISSPLQKVVICIGLSLFSSRFWVQWWQAEQAQRSYIGKPFWILSIAGALLSCTYFYQTRDIINLLGYGWTLLPSTRNLILLQREKYSNES